MSENDRTSNDLGDPKEMDSNEKGSSDVILPQSKKKKITHTTDDLVELDIFNQENEERENVDESVHSGMVSDLSLSKNKEKKTSKTGLTVDFAGSDQYKEQNDLVRRKKLKNMERKKKKKLQGKNKLVSAFLDTEAQVGEEDEDEYEEIYETVDTIEQKEARELEAKRMQDFRMKTSGTNHLAQTINKLSERYNKDQEKLKGVDVGDLTFQGDDLEDDDMLDDDLDDMDDFSDQDLMANIAAVERQMDFYESPKLWLVKLFRGNGERSLATSIFYKFLKCRSKENDCSIKGVYVSDNLKGYIYVEADSLYLLRKFLYGFRIINLSEISIVPLQELTSIFEMCQSTLQFPKIHEYVRIKKGLYANDIGQVYDVNEKGAYCIVRLIPRISFEKPYVSGNRPAVATMSNLLSENALSILDKKAEVVNEVIQNQNGESLQEDKMEERETHKEVTKQIIHLRNKVKKERPVKNFFDREKIENLGGYVEVGPYPKTYKYQENVYDANGYLLKKMTNKFLILGNTNISCSEITEFNKNIQNKRDFPVRLSKNMMNKQRILLFRKNERVKIMKGEFMNLTGVVTDLKENSLVIRPDQFTKEFEFLPAEVSKYFVEGDSVTVISGVHKGKSGLVSLLDYKKDIALVFCPCVSTEFQTSIAHLCLSSQQLEEYAGVKTFGGYSIGDLIEMSDHQIGILTYIDKNKNARVLTYDNDMVHTTISAFTNKRSSFGQVCRDMKFNMIQAMDKILVHKGSYRGKLGQVLHVWKNKVFVKINTKVQDYGMAVLDGESFVLSGNPQDKRKLPVSTNNMFRSNNYGRTNVNPFIGKTVKILKGMYKGLYADVIDAEREEFTLLLKIKPKTVRQKKVECVIVDSYHGKAAITEDHPKDMDLTSKDPDHILRDKDVLMEKDFLNTKDYSKKKEYSREKDFRRRENNDTQAMYIGTDGRMKDRRGMEHKMNKEAEGLSSMNRNSSSKNNILYSSAHEKYDKTMRKSSNSNKGHNTFNNERNMVYSGEKHMETNWDDLGGTNNANGISKSSEKKHAWAIEGVLVQVIVSGRFCNQIGVIQGISIKQNFEVIRVQTETATFNIVAEALIPLHPKRVNDNVIFVNGSTIVRGKVILINDDEVKIKPLSSDHKETDEISAQMENVFACVNEDDLLKIIK